MALARFSASRPTFRSAPAPHAVSVVGASDTHAANAEADVAGVEGRFGRHLALLIWLHCLQPLAIIGFTARRGVVMRQKGFELSSLVCLAVAGVAALDGAPTAVLFVDRAPRHLHLRGFLLRSQRGGHGVRAVVQPWR